MCLERRPHHAANSPIRQVDRWRPGRLSYAMTDLELHRSTTHGRHRLQVRSTIVYGILGTRNNILSNRRRLVATQDSSRFPVAGQRWCCPGPGAKQSSHWPNDQPSSFWRRTGTPYVGGCGWKPKVTSPPQYVAFSEFLFRFFDAWGAFLGSNSAQHLPL